MTSTFVSVPNKMKKLFLEVINKMNEKGAEINKVYHQEINDMITNANYLKLKKSLENYHSTELVVKNKKI